MRKLPAGVALSAAVHTAALAWVATYTPEPPPLDLRPPTTIEIIEAAERDDDEDTTALDVALLDEGDDGGGEDISDELAAEPERNAPATSRLATRSRTGTEIGTGTGTTPGTGEPGPGLPGKNPWLDMRKGKPVRLTVGVPTGRWDGRERAPDSYGPDIDSGELDPSGGGTYRSDQGPFTAKVDQDGSVNFKDKRNFHINLKIPSYKNLKKGLGNKLRSWIDDDKKPVGTIATDRTTKQVVLNGERYEDQDDKPDHGKTVPILGGGFDITDALMRRNGQDPYASKKLTFLDSTRDQRVQIGNRYRQKQLARANEIMQTNLDRAWKTLADLSARREALFELWDECAETGTDELIEAGTAARKLVVGFIRAKLPAGSEHAFSDADIAAFNKKKQSKATFAPYE